MESGAGAVAFPRQGSLAVCPLRLWGDALLLGLKGIGGTDPVGVHASGHEVVDPDVVWRELQRKAFDKPSGSGAHHVREDEDVDEGNEDQGSGGEQEPGGVLFFLS